MSRRTRPRYPTIAAAALFAALACAGRTAAADDAIVAVGRYAQPAPRERTEPLPLADDPPERRSTVRIEVGPSLVTTGEGAGLGATAAAAFGTGSVGGRLYGAWNRGEGARSDGRSTATGDAMSQYGAELTVDVLKRARIHPLLGVGAAALHVSRPDGGSGFAGAGTLRLGVEIGLGLDDADVRVAGGVTGGLVGPAASEVRDLTAYAMTTVGLVVGL